MKRYEQVRRIVETAIFAVIRAESSEQLVDVARALKDGGCELVEVAMTTPNAFAVIEKTAAELGEEVLVGVGSVLDAETARGAILSGAQYIVSPVTNYDVIEMAHRYDKVAIPGAFTPTETMNAFAAGADLVKIFPASVGGPSYIKALKAPMPQVLLVPTGGVDLDNVAYFLRAGGDAVGVGSSMIQKEALEKGDMEQIRKMAAAFTDRVKEARGG